MKKKHLGIALTLVVGVIFNLKQVNAENYVECYQCSNSDTKSSADSWANMHVSQREADRRVTKDIHIIDLYNKLVTSYNVTLRSQPKPPPAAPFPPEYVPYSQLIITPAHLQAEMNDVKGSMIALKQKAESLVIPTTVIENAWESIGCAYCQNQINDYVNQHISGKLQTAQMVVERVALMFGLINTSTPDTYIIPLESGGHVVVKVTVTHAPTQLEIAVIKFVDIDNNTVPPSATNLKNVRVRVTKVEYASSMNRYLNLFSFYIPLQTGTATVTDCGSGPDGQPKECPGDGNH